jgi:hypothetical protein
MWNTFLETQGQVQLIMEAGRPLDDAEEVINDPDLDCTDDERAALWLYSWSLVPRHRQHEMALRYLESLDPEFARAGA